MSSVILIIELLSLIAAAVPKVAPAVKDILEMLKGEPVTDITQEEFEARIDAAIAKLPPWD
jgi:hypothetical protein